MHYIVDYPYELDPQEPDSVQNVTIPAWSHAAILTFHGSKAGMMEANDNSSISYYNLLSKFNDC